MIFYFNIIQCKTSAFGYAYIPMIPEAVPQRQKNFQLQGERLEAHKKVTQYWADHWFIERPPRGFKMYWESVTFCNVQFYLIHIMDSMFGQDL